jgi:hypothetical protein
MRPSAPSIPFSWKTTTEIFRMGRYSGIRQQEPTNELALVTKLVAFARAEQEAGRLEPLDVETYSHREKHCTPDPTTLCKMSPWLLLFIPHFPDCRPTEESILIVLEKINAHVPLCAMPRATWLRWLATRITYVLGHARQLVSFPTRLIYRISLLSDEDKAIIGQLKVALVAAGVRQKGRSSEDGASVVEASLVPVPAAADARLVPAPAAVDASLLPAPATVAASPVPVPAAVAASLVAPADGQTETAEVAFFLLCLSHAKVVALVFMFFARLFFYMFHTNIHTNTLYVCVYVYWDLLIIGTVPAPLADGRCCAAAAHGHTLPSCLRHTKARGGCKGFSPGG